MRSVGENIADQVQSDLKEAFPYCKFMVTRKYIKSRRQYFYTAVLNEGPVQLYQRNGFMLIPPSGNTLSSLAGGDRSENLLVKMFGKFIRERSYKIYINLSNGYTAVENIEFQKIYALHLLKKHDNGNT